MRCACFIFGMERRGCPLADANAQLRRPLTAGLGGDFVAHLPCLLEPIRGEGRGRGHRHDLVKRRVGG